MAWLQVGNLRCIPKMMVCKRCLLSHMAMLGLLGGYLLTGIGLYLYFRRFQSFSPLIDLSNCEGKESTIANGILWILPRTLVIVESVKVKKQVPLFKTVMATLRSPAKS